MEINEKIKDYELGTDYTPLMVEISIIPPLCLTSPYILFDSLLSYLCLRDCLGEDYYSLPTHKTINLDDLRLPLKKTEDVYHASIGVFNDFVIKKDTIYKRFTDKEAHVLTDKQNKGRVKTNQGHYKDFMINLPLILTNKVRFYCNGDKNSINYLLKHLTSIGKKTSIGCGRIKDYTITDALDDYSFFKDTKVMRPIPCTMKIPLTEGMVMQRSSYKAPYWSKSNKTMCFMPQTNLTEQ